MNQMGEELNLRRRPFRERRGKICNSLYSLDGFYIVYFRLWRESPLIWAMGRSSRHYGAILSHHFRYFFLQTAISIGRVDKGTSDNFSGLGHRD